MSRILIVGAGLTGGTVNYLLMQLFRQSGQLLPIVTVWDSCNFCGGRMRSLELSSPAASHNRCDLGAQYISQGVSGSGFCDDLYEYLKNRGTLKVMGDNNLINGMRPEHQLGKHFIAPAGTSSIVSTLLEGANVITGKKLLKLSLNVQSFTFVAQTAVDGAEEFDAVITTMMAPQLKVLFNATPKHVKTEREERIDEMVDLSVPADVLAGLDKVAYSSRFALAAFYKLPSPEEKHRVLASVAWGAKYVLDDDVIRYVSIENFKYKDQEVATHPEPDADNVVSILVHTTVPFGLAHKDVLRGCGAESRADLAQPPHPDPDTQQKQKQAVIEAILRSVVKGQVLPALSAYAPAQVQLVGWEQSQVTRSYHHAGRGTVGDLDTSRGVLSSNGQAANERSELIAAAPSALVLSVGADGVATLIPGGSSATFAASDGDGKSAAAAASESVQSVPRMPLLVLAGDAFTESNFDGCIKSAHFAAQAVAKHILGR